MITEKKIVDDIPRLNECLPILPQWVDDALKLFTEEAVQSSSWTVKHNKGNSKVFRRPVDGSSFYLFRGETEFNAPSSVLEDLLDKGAISRAKEWQPVLIEGEILSEKQAGESEELPSSDSLRVMHMAYKSPALVENRDFVYVMITRKLPNGFLTISRSITNEDAPAKKGFCRGELMMCGYLVTDIGDNRCRLVQLQHADPKGWIPSSLVNTTQTGIMCDEYNHIRKIVENSQ